MECDNMKWINLALPAHWMMFQWLSGSLIEISVWVNRSILSEHFFCSPFSTHLPLWPWQPCLNTASWRTEYWGTVFYADWLVHVEHTGPRARPVRDAVLWTFEKVMTRTETVGVILSDAESILTVRKKINLDALQLPWQQTFDRSGRGKDNEHE